MMPLTDIVARSKSRLEPLVEEVHRAHGEHLELEHALFGRQSASTLPKLYISAKRAGLNDPGSGGDHLDDRLDAARHLHHRLAELRVDLGVAPAEVGDLASCAFAVAPTRQPRAVVLRRERAVHRQDLQSEPGQLEVADDLRSQQTHDVAADRELEAGEDLFGNRRAAEHIAALEHECLLASLGEVGGAGQPVVAAADHDGVVARRHGRSGTFALRVEEGPLDHTRGDAAPLVLDRVFDGELGAELGMLRAPGCEARCTSLERSATRCRWWPCPTCRPPTYTGTAVLHASPAGKLQRHTRTRS